MLYAAKEEQLLRSQAERQVADSLRYQGRDPKFFLNGSERAALMGIALRWAFFCSVVAMVLAATGYAAEVWQHGWPRNPLGHVLIPIFALVAAFLYQRGRLLDRAAAEWKPIRDRMIAETLAILRSQQQKDPLPRRDAAVGARRADPNLGNGGRPNL